MPYKTDPSAFLADWWQFAIFVVGAFAAYIAGKERQRFKVDQIGQEVERQGQRIKTLETQGNAEAVQLAKIVTSQGYIVQSLDEIKETLKGKADK